jgi:methylthioribose-1-phosphate isomerase
VIPRTLEWRGGVGGTLRLLDQTGLPRRVRHLTCRTAGDVWKAIRRLAVRGAPAIGCAAAYGMVLGVRACRLRDRAAVLRAARRTADFLASARPTAVNLRWAVERVLSAVERSLQNAGPGDPGGSPLAAALREARVIEREDRAMCAAIGRHGARLFRRGGNVLTHCNAGALATAGIGTALAPLYVAARRLPRAKPGRGGRLHVWVDETRPLLQGARLTLWELMRAGVPATLVADNMAASLFRAGRVGAVIVGADRIAANGDTANKIGTYGVAVLARAHGVPFYVAAPSSTFDPATPDGARIPIEERPPDEVAAPGGVRWAPPGARVHNPAFDVTPARLITAFITERGVLRPPYRRAIRRWRGG